MCQPPVEAAKVIHFRHALADRTSVLCCLPYGLVHPWLDSQRKLVVVVDEKIYFNVVNVKQLVDESLVWNLD